MYGTDKGRKTESCIVLKTNNKANIEKNIFKIFAFLFGQFRNCQYLCSVK